MDLFEQTNKTHEIEVKVISREMIKPSCPTPNDKKTVQFSLIDQIATSAYIPIILFYQNNNNPNYNNSTDNLKKALSETLVHFYPLAGRIKQNELIHCTDEGVEFCEANVSRDLVEYIDNPSLVELQAMLPFQGTPRHINIVLSIQVNHFTCGGMAMGVCLSHKIADASANVVFLKAWATKAQDADYRISTPKFNGASLFPPLKELNETTLDAQNDEVALAPQKFAVRRLIFDEETTRGMKAEVAEGTAITDPTRVEVVTAFLWRYLPRKFSSLLQIVNLRKRMVSPVTEGFFGNCAWVTKLSPMGSNGGRNECPEVVIDEFRKAVNKISQAYMPDFLGRDNFLVRLQKEIEFLFYPLGEFILCNSLSGFPLYEVNFGIGNPIWVCPGATPAMNAVIAMGTKCGKGIEAWIFMLEDHIPEFDTALSQLRYPVVKSVNMK